MSIKLFVTVLFCLLSFSSSGMADTVKPLDLQVKELAQAVQELRQIVQTQQMEIAELKNGQGGGTPIGGAAAGTSSASAGGRPSTISSGRWNPDIGVIGDAVFKHDSPKNETDGSDRLSLRELELIVGSYVDPYSRFDASISFSDLEEVELHEAYLTRFGLPFDTTARIGRVKPKIGKALPAHRDTLETVDYPLVIRRYFGEDSMSKTGVDFTKPIDLPLDSAHEISVGVLEGGGGEGGTAFGESRRRPTVYSRLRNFRDVSDVTNFELGASHMIGSQDDDAGFETNVFGVDGTWIHLYGPDQRVKFQNELFHLRQRESEDKNRLGAYSLLDVRFHKRWSSGLRFDLAQIPNQPLRTNQGGTDAGITGYLTFFQTEFSRWRLQYTHIEATDGKDDDQVMIQGIFAIGEHKHKLQ